MTPAPYDLILGLDRADSKADLCLLDPATGQRRTAVVDTAPEALCEWLAALRQQHPAARVGLKRTRVPVVLNRAECERLFDALEGPPRLMAELKFGSGIRLTELLRLA